MPMAGVAATAKAEMKRDKKSVLRITVNSIEWVLGGGQGELL
jgi:hypothetical protein